MALLPPAHLQLLALPSSAVGGREVGERKETFISITHNWKLSLYLGAQLLFLDLVANFLFLSLRLGPMMLTSMKGRKMPDVCHFRSLAATTARKRARSEQRGTRQSCAVCGVCLAALSFCQLNC